MEFASKELIIDKVVTTLNVIGDGCAFDVESGESTFGGNVYINATTSSTNPSNGALVIAGGVGIGGNLNVSGDVTFGSSLTSLSNRYFMAIHTSPISVNSTTYTPVTWNTIKRQDALVYTHSPASANITLLSAGDYNIQIDLSTEILSGNGIFRTISSGIVSKNGTEIIGSKLFMYNRTNLLGLDTASCKIIENCAVNDVLSVSVNRFMGNSTVTTVANACRIFIEKI
jgi:hypothetical protein